MMAQEIIKLDEYHAMKKRGNKYHAKQKTVDNIRFDSKKEAARYQDLKLLEHAQSITGLRCQVWFTMLVNNILVCRYRADFCYIEDGKEIVEDCKGFRTDSYKIKAKLMHAVHGIIIRET
jgi:hypothetical protein